MTTIVELNNNKRRNRRPRRRNNVRRVKVVRTTTRNRRPRRRGNVRTIPGISKDGMAFLKCAFAAPDFNQEGVAGIPDQFTGRTLLKKHKYVSSVSFAAAFDTYILVLPTPGQAYWTASVAIGTPILANTTWTSVPYSDYATLFGPSGSEADRVNKFRYVSSAFEIVNTTNEMNWAGSISVWKAPMSITMNPISTGGALVYGFTGAQACNQTSANQYVAPYVDGCYTMATQDDPDFEFTPIMEACASVPNALGAMDFTRLVPAAGAPSIPGFGNLNTLIIRVSVPGATPMAGVIRAWSCVDYLPTPGGALYDYSRTSPDYDPLALRMYSQIIRQLPVAVCYRDNARFWELIKSFMVSTNRAVNRATGVMSVLPGPYGIAARGANMFTGAIESMMT